MTLLIHYRELQLRSPFRIAHGSRRAQPTLIVELRDPATGLSGLGEAPLTSYYGLERDAGVVALRNLAPAAPPRFTGADDFLARTDRAAPDLHPFLRCALDVAAHDLAARAAGVRLGESWYGPGRPTTPTCYTIGLGSPAEMADKARATPWPIYKVKLGGRDGGDLARIRALRAVTDCPLYVDANTAWTLDEALALVPALAELGVVLVEQPLPPGDPGQARLFRESPLPLIADESCQTEADVARCAAHFHGVNVKVVKCGGLAPARRMLAEARRRGLRSMAGCMTESSVGISAIAQLLPALDYADLDGAMLIANDPARGVTFGPTDGRVRYPAAPGTGAELIA